MHPMPPLILLAAASLAATPLAAAPVPAAPRFDAVTFFDGRTEGIGRMKVLLGPHRPVHVHGRGHVEPDGALVLDQTVDRAGHAPTSRKWRIRRAGPSRYAGTLTEARGPVRGATIGDRLHLAYEAAGHVSIDQWLTLAPDGRSARNRLTARKLGVVVARLDETIRKVD
ncbi:MAG: DUF3833 family protein [Sphingomonas sp.]